MELTKIDILRIYGGQFWGFSGKIDFPKLATTLTETTTISAEIVEKEVIPITEKPVIAPANEPVKQILPKEEVKIPVAIPEIKKEEPAPPPVIPAKEVVLPKVEPISAPQSPFEGGEKIVWKMKKQSKLALVMEEEMFQNTLLMKALRVFLVEEAGINADFIGFGLFSKGTERWNFSDMPTPFALLFGGEKFSKNLNISINEKRVFLTFALTEIVLDKQKQIEAKNRLIEIKKIME